MKTFSLSAFESSAAPLHIGIARMPIRIDAPSEITTQIIAIVVALGSARNE